MKYKNLREYVGGSPFLGGFRLGSFPTLKPMASLGDKGPKYPAGQQSLGVGINANKSVSYTRAPGTMRPFLKASNNKLINKIKDKYNLTKDQIATLTRLPMPVLTNILNSAGAITQYLPMSEKKWSKKYKDSIDCNNPKGFSQKAHCQGKKKKEETVLEKWFDEAEKRVPRKYKSQDPKQHSDLYTDEDPKDTITGLGFVDAKKARQSISKIKGSGRTHAHKMQAAMAMHQRARVAADRAKNPESKKNLHAAEKVYKAFIEKMKKITKERQKNDR
tara:strand:+ start:842 stop:1666 length:825 start_codon:yes stop_codon:yes gene_type:complete